MQGGGEDDGGFVGGEELDGDCAWAGDGDVEFEDGVAVLVVQEGLDEEVLDVCLGECEQVDVAEDAREPPLVCISSVIV